MLSPEEMALIDFRTHPRAKRIKVTANQAKGLIFTAPESASLETCKKFLDQNSDWVRKYLKLIKEKQSERAFNFETDFQTFFKKLELIPTELSEIRSRISEQKIKIYINPENLDQKKTQNAIKKIIIQVLRDEAKLYLPNRIKELAQKLGLKYKNITIKDMKSQWAAALAAIILTFLYI